jgi:hypothetical protein
VCVVIGIAHCFFHGDLQSVAQRERFIVRDGRIDPHRDLHGNDIAALVAARTATVPIAARTVIVLADHADNVSAAVDYAAND